MRLVYEKAQDHTRENILVKSFLEMVMVRDPHIRELSCPLEVFQELQGDELHAGLSGDSLPGRLLLLHREEGPVPFGSLKL